MGLFEVNQQFDIKGVSFHEFVDFIFEHEVPPETDRNGRRSQRWYNEADIEFDPRQLVEHYTNLFQEPRFLLERYSREKLEQGFWAIMGGLLDCSIVEAIWSEEVDLRERTDCVRFMYFLYEKFFSVDPLDTSGHMWWDSLAYDWQCGNRDRSRGGEDLIMQDVMFETLERILALPSLSCQGAALHGLGHLHHPMTLELIDAYLARNPDLDQETIDYAKAAARFEVL